MTNERLDEYLAKANALIQVALHDEFLDYPDKIIHNYLWVVSEMLERACASSGSVMVGSEVACANNPLVFCKVCQHD